MSALITASGGDGAERDDALKHCPPFVRNQILRFLYNATIANSYLLEDTTTTLVDTLTNFVQLEFFFPDTPLIEPFQMPASLFFIVEGTVEMTDEGAALRLLKEGDTFGEEAVLCNVTTPVRPLRLQREWVRSDLASVGPLRLVGRRAQLEYKTVSFCRVLLLDRMELNSVLEKMPAEHRVVQKNVLKQLEAWMAEEKTNLARAMVTYPLLHSDGAKARVCLGGRALGGGRAECTFRHPSAGARPYSHGQSRQIEGAV